VDPDYPDTRESATPPKSPAEVHSSIGGSKAARWMNCTLSPHLEKEFPAIRTDDMDLGVAAHLLASIALQAERPAADYLGTVLTCPGGNTFEVDDEMAASVQVYLDAVHDFLVAFPGSELLIEHKFDLSYLFKPEELELLKACGLEPYGTVDACVVQPFGTLVVLDYKHGIGDQVEAQDNAQLGFYTAGALALPEALSCEEVLQVIVQPRGLRKDSVTTDSKSADFMRGWAATELHDKAMACTANVSPKVGPWCKRCSGRANCKAQNEKFCEVIRTSPISPPIAPNVVPLFTEPHKMMPADRERVLLWGPSVKNWIDACFAFEKQQQELGQGLPSFKLVEGRARREWTDEATVVEKLTPEVAYEQKLRSPAQVEKVLAEGGMEKAVAKAIVADYTTERRGKSLVAATDKRPAITPTAAFQPVTPDHLS
jgi:hypothetical protein